MNSTIQIRDGVSLERSSIVTYSVIPFAKRSPRIKLDFGSMNFTGGETIGESFTLTITTTDGATHKLDEQYSAVAFEILEQGKKQIKITNRMNADITQDELEIFISHSSKDADVAEALIELIRAALDVPHSKIRCTSVDGYRLSAGVFTDEELQREVRVSRCFIALLTPSSLQSSYVLFELGARWGARLSFLPLLAKGLKASSLKMPLSSLNALSCSSNSQIHQFLGDIGRSVGRASNSPAQYDKYLQRLQGFHADTIPPGSEQRFEAPETEGGTQRAAPLGAEAQQLLQLIEQEPDINQRGIVEILKEFEPGQTPFFPRLQYGGGPISMKTRLFREAIRQLLTNDRLHPPEDNPSTNTRTYEYCSSGQN